MMGYKAGWIMGALVSAGLVLGSVSPAEARPRYGYDRGWDGRGHGGWDRHRRHRGDGFGVGDVIGVAALVGAVAIVASSLSKDKKARAGSVPRDDAVGQDAPAYRGNADYGADADPARDDADGRPDFGDGSVADRQDDALTDACALAARDEAQGQYGGYAEVRRIDRPQAIAAGGYNIDGEVETRASYRESHGVTRRFTCAMTGGRVGDIYFSRDLVMR